MKMGRYGSYSMEKSTTISPCASNSSRAATVTAHTATPKTSFTFTKNTVEDCVQHLARNVRLRHLESQYEIALFIARDRLGIKPLYYKLTSERLLFGSEIKVLFAHGGIRPEFNRPALPGIPRVWIFIWRGNFLRWDSQVEARTYDDDRARWQAHIRQYWDLDASKSHESHDESYYVQSYRELLEGAVNSHLMSDVPLGVFLSGGVDSSAVAALMTKLRREPVETFSVGYTETDL